MELALSKIRPHVSSALPHQKTPATLLLALEATLKEQNAEGTPTAYFAAVLTTLDGTIQKGDLGFEEGDVLPAELYLLALVLPYAPPPVVRAHLQTLLSLTTPLFPSLQAHPPPLRSLLSIYQAIFLSLDRSQLDTQGIRQSFAMILQLCVDHRPKVRKKAAELVHHLLSNPPTPMAHHPYATRVADWAAAVLSAVNDGPLSKSKSKNAEMQGTETAIHLLSFLRPILTSLPATNLPPLISSLLPLSHLGNVYLTQSTYNALSDLLRFQVESSLDGAGERISGILEVVLSSPPVKSDTIISPAWVDVLGSAMKAYREVDAQECAKLLPRVWKVIWPFLESSEATTRGAAAGSLEKLCGCITLSLASSAVGSQGVHSPFGKIIQQLLNALDTLALARAIPELLSTVSALLRGLRFRQSRETPTFAELLLLPFIERVGALRMQKGFEHKEAADAFLGVSMEVLGADVLLRILPLNLDANERQSGLEPRAFLLPLLSRPHPTPLSHFVSYFIPLSGRMFDIQQKAEAEGRESESKVWEVLIAQIWAGLAGYCHGPPDLKQALTPEFSQMLSQLLYSQPDLRPALLKALKLIVDSNVTIAAKAEPSNDDQITPAEAAANVDFLRSQAESWLAVLFNVFGTVNRDVRVVVGNVITAWIAIVGEQEVGKAFVKVLSLFKSNFQDQQPKPVHSGGENDPNSVTAITQDILIILLPYLPESSSKDLFNVCLSREVLAAKDNGVQKRGYKILSKLIEFNRVSPDALAILEQLDGFLDGLSPAAKKDRFTLLSFIIATIPNTSLHVIPSLIPEAVLGTKEPSEKARSAAFDLIVAMGRKMNEGGVVKKSLVDGMDEDNAEDATANVQEFITMIAAGLAGASPHMVSATVTAISRLIFEFKDVVPDSMHTEIFMTMLVLLGSANREIVKSTLGFVKLAVHTLPTQLLEPHLKELVSALLKWSHDHKNHFKEKVRQIFERMIRRFGWDAVYAAAEGDQAAKFLVNIKKRKDRAKRKKANAEVEDASARNDNKPTTGDAFEDILYGSGSESDGSDNEDEKPASRRGKKQVLQGARLKVDDEEPVDLLQGMASRITSASTKKHRSGQDAAYFRTDEDTGKIVIEGDSDYHNEVEEEDEDVSGNAYKEALTSADGFTRNARGHVKFNKDTKKRRREIEEDEDVEMEDSTVTRLTKSPKTHSKPGHEFKAKRAGGDVKKGGVDPYAYVSLSQAAKPKGRKRIGIAGKR